MQIVERGYSDRRGQGSFQSGFGRGFYSGQRGRGNNRRGGYQRYVPSLRSLPARPALSLVGGRLRLFAAECNKVTTDAWVLKTARDGLLIDFSAIPFQSSLPRVAAMVKEMKAACDEEVVSLLEKGAVCEIVCKIRSNSVVSTLYLSEEKK